MKNIVLLAPVFDRVLYLNTELKTANGTEWIPSLKFLVSMKFFSTCSRWEHKTNERHDTDNNVNECMCVCMCLSVCVYVSVCVCLCMCVSVCYPFIQRCNIHSFLGCATTLWSCAKKLSASIALVLCAEKVNVQPWTRVFYYEVKMEVVLVNSVNSWSFICCLVAWNKLHILFSNWTIKVNVSLTAGLCWKPRTCC